MKIGDVIRTTHIRSYFTGKEARGYAEFVANPKSVRKREDKNVFVMVLLGMEPMCADESEQIDTTHQLNALGCWGEDQLIEVMGKKKAEALVEKLVRKAKEKHESKGS